MVYLFLGVGVWCLFYAWRGVVPEGGGKAAGKPMQPRTRFIYGLGGIMIFGLGLLMLTRRR